MGRRRNKLMATATATATASLSSAPPRPPWIESKWFRMGRRRNKSRKLAATASSSSAPPRPQWIDLPYDVTSNILQRLGSEEVLRNAQRVCRTWRKVCHDPAMWRVVSLKNPHEVEYFGFYSVLTLAVNRSQGQLIDLSIAFFGDDDLMNFVADRSSNLRRLTITKPYKISGEALVETVKKLPQLEELHLIMMSGWVRADHVETIGISCPMLKSFTLGEEMFEYLDDGPQPEEDYFNEYGLAIGETMPNLRHLRLISNQIKNKGLEAILDGCPYLESLDLRKCFGLELDLRGALGERCTKQIKDLRLPSDSIRDLEWPFEESDSDYDEYDSDEEE